MLVSTGAVTCYPVLMVKKIWFLHDEFLKFYSCSHKIMQNNHIYVSVGIVGLSKFHMFEQDSALHIELAKWLRF